MNFLHSAMIITISMTPFIGPSSLENEPDIEELQINMITNTTALKDPGYNYTSSIEYPTFSEPSNSMFVTKSADSDLMVSKDELVMASISNRFFEKLSTWQGTPDHVAENVDEFLKTASQGTYNISVISMNGFRKKLQITVE